jgi:hypothetical protein
MLSGLNSQPSDSKAAMTEHTVSKALLNGLAPHRSIALMVFAFTAAFLASFVWLIPTRARAARNWLPVFSISAPHHPNHNHSQRNRQSSPLSHDPETGGKGGLALFFGGRDYFRPVMVQFGQRLLVAVQHGPVGEVFSTL